MKNMIVPTEKQREQEGRKGEREKKEGGEKVWGVIEWEERDRKEMKETQSKKARERE